VLEDISMYTAEGDMRMADVFLKLKDAKKLPGAQDEVKEQRQFLVDTIGLESERVYDSDIKKLFSWFSILKDQLDFDKLKEGNEAGETEEGKEGKEDAKVVDEAPKTRKESGPKPPRNTAGRTNTKGAGGSKTTYRPKSGS
jgi:hypothetical protein